MRAAPDDQIMARYGLAGDLRQELQERVRRGRLGPDRNILTGHVRRIEYREPILLSQLNDDFDTLGAEAIKRGEVAVVILNGGMGTRFGGVVKGAVPVSGDTSFLQLKIDLVDRLAQRLGASIRVLLMNSWATDTLTTKLLESVYGNRLIESFQQFISYRFRVGGDLFRDRDGRTSIHGCGHGDLAMAMVRSGTIHDLLDSGVKYVVVSNVDNIAATLSPRVVGLHIGSRNQATVEVVPGESRGGGPVIHDGRLRLIEQQQMPQELMKDWCLTNTNSFVFSLESLQRIKELEWLYVEKSVDGEIVVQIERACAATCDQLSTGLVVVPDGGRDGRFLPIKDRFDLLRVSAQIERLMRLSKNSDS